MIMYLFLMAVLGWSAGRSWKRDRASSILLVAVMVIYTLGLVVFGAPPAGVVD